MPTLFPVIKRSWQQACDLISTHFRLRGIDTPLITVFGSARIKKGDRYYQLGVDLGKSLAENGYGVMTGGGGGMMGAVAKGANSVKGMAIGCNLQLHNEKPNPDNTINLNFRYFATRKMALVKYSKAFVVLPGGFGTFDELFELLSLILTYKLPERPIILLGKDFWQGLITWFEEQLITNGTINHKDLEKLVVVDSVEECLQLFAQDNLQSISREVE